MKNNIIFSLIVLSLFITGCASMRPVPLDTAGLRDQLPAKLYVVQYKSPEFMLLRSKKVFWNSFLLGGVVGGITAYKGAQSEGEKLRFAYHLEDPTTVIKKNFLDNIGSDPTLADLPREEASESSDKMKDLKKQFGDSLVLDFKTTSWGYSYYPLAWSHYRLGYMVRARLTEPSRNKVLWQGICSYQEKKDDNQRPTFKDLSTGDGQLIRSELETATRECTQQLLAQYNKQVAKKPMPTQHTKEVADKTAAQQPMVEPTDTEMKSNVASADHAPGPEKNRPSSQSGCSMNDISIQKLYPLERCEVAVLVKRCGPGDACMIDCYANRKGDGVEGGCYKICNTSHKGWTIPSEWDNCR